MTALFMLLLKDYSYACEVLLSEINGISLRCWNFSISLIVAKKSCSILYSACSLSFSCDSMMHAY